MKKIPSQVESTGLRRSSVLAVGSVSASVFTTFFSLVATVLILRFLPRDAYYCGGEALPLLDEQDRLNKKLIERVCADQIVPYPPGIPVLVPGQLITANVVAYLGDLLHSTKRMEMHGVVHEGYIPCVRVLKPGEEKGLQHLP